MSRLYTYLPKDNTALKEGLLSTALSDKGFEKYRGRTGKYKKEDVLKVLDSWEPEWTRSKAISALAEPIPEDAAEDLREFANKNELYSFDLKDLIKAKILIHLRHTNKKRGTYQVEGIDENDKYNWKRKPHRLLFKGIPHYMVETAEGKIPPKFVTEEKKASAKSDFKDIVQDYKDRFGVDLSHMRMQQTKHPRFTNGKWNKSMPDAESGGSWGKDSVVYINRDPASVVKHWNFDMSPEEFRRLIIAHELAHELFNKPTKDSRRLIRNMLRRAREEKFRTVYLDTYEPDTDKKKMQNETFAEYMAKLLSEKKAAASSVSKDKTGFGR